jgi:hypothetical protein
MKTCIFFYFYRLCKDLNLTVPGSPRMKKEDLKTKRRRPKKVTCDVCRMTLRDKYVLQKHVSFFVIYNQCCGSGFGIRCLFDRLDPDPEWVKSQDPDPGWQSGSSFQELRNHLFGLKILKFFDEDVYTGSAKLSPPPTKFLFYYLSFVGTDAGPL